MIVIISDGGIGSSVIILKQELFTIDEIIFYQYKTLKCVHIILSKNDNQTIQFNQFTQLC